MLQGHRRFRHELLVHFIGITEPLAPCNAGKLATRVVERTCGQHLQQVAEANECRRLAPAASSAEKEREALRGRAAPPKDVSLAVFVDVRLVQVPDLVVGQPRPIADRMGPGFVRDHAQRQVVALEIAVIAFPPYTHGNMLRRRRPLRSKVIT